MKNPVYETMTRWEGHGMVFRIWRNEPGFAFGPDVEVIETLEAWNGGSIKSIVKKLGRLERVEAIEVLNYVTGNGGLFYPDWK